MVRTPQVKLPASDLVNENLSHNDVFLASVHTSEPSAVHYKQNRREKKWMRWRRGRFANFEEEV